MRKWSASWMNLTLFKWYWNQHINAIYYLVFTTHPELIDKTYVLPGMCAHDAVIFDLNIKTPTSRSPPWRVYLYKTDMEGIKNKMRESYTAFLTSNPTSKPVDENWTQFKTDLLNATKEFISQKNLKQKNALPWCNSHIRLLIQKKQRRYNVACRSGSDHDRHCFRKLRKLIYKKLKEAQQEYVNSLLEINND